MDEVSASKSVQPTFLTLEANQEAYVQVWKTVGSSIPKLQLQLQLPEKETGGISPKLALSQRQYFALPIESGPFTLTVRLSRAPFDPVARQESGMSDRPSLDQLQESITEGNRASSRERVTYVVGQPSTTAQITADIILGQ